MSDQKIHNKKINRKIAASVMVIVLLIILLFVYKKLSAPQTVSEDFFAMDTHMSITATGKRARTAVAAAREEIQRLDHLWSCAQEDSEVCQLNENAGGNLSSDTEKVLVKALEIYRVSEGTFDISIYPVMQLWGFTGQEYQIPEKAALAQALEMVDAENIRLNVQEHTAQWEAGMKIDFGGIAKGYASQRVMEIFEEYDIVCGMVSLGGNVQVYGQKTDGSMYRVGIVDPQNSENILGVVQVQDQAVITSGGYERYFESEGVRYHHIIDPKTGYPAESGILSATIVSADGVLADGLSTAMFVSGIEQAAQIWREHAQEFQMILETADETIYITDGLKDVFSTEFEKLVVIEK